MISVTVTVNLNNTGVVVLIFSSMDRCNCKAQQGVELTPILYFTAFAVGSRFPVEVQPLFNFFTL